VQLVSDEENLHLNTTDTYRVGSALLHDAGWGVFSGLVPLSVLERVADSEIHEVAVDVKGRVIEFSGAKVRFIVRLSASQFPRVEATLSLVPVHSIQVSLSLLRVALARLGALVESNALQCTIADGELRLSVRSALGDGVEILEVTGEDSTEFAVMLDYLRTSLIGREGDLVTLRWTNATSPLFITSSDPLAITTIVMPVRM
jgi:DNA polymerase III sliding clamp (beta) subunit (PCNA family)